MITLALLIIALALYLLGMKQISDYFPMIARMLEQQGRTFNTAAKAKMLFLWPYIVIKDFFDDYKAKKPSADKPNV